MARAADRGAFLPGLHGMRGLLALWVVTFHVNENGFGALRVPSYGYVAVDAFFLMSGYLLMQSHHADFVHVRAPAVFDFLRRRFWRTYPLHFSTLVLSASLFPLLYGWFPGPERILGSLALLEGWAVKGLSVNWPVWSLGVEWVGYLMFPLVAWACVRLTAERALVLAIGVLTAEAGYFAVWQDLPMASQTAGVHAVLRMAGAFVAGCLLWRGHTRSPRPTDRRDDAAMALAVLGCAIVFWTVSAWWCLPFLLAVVHLAARPGPLTSRLLGSSPAQFLGRISFALYLCHTPIKSLVIWTGWFSTGVARPIGTVLIYAAALACATLLCVTIEEPMRRFGRKPMQPALALSK